MTSWSVIWWLVGSLVYIWWVVVGSRWLVYRVLEKMALREPKGRPWGGGGVPAVKPPRWGGCGDERH